jgi:hypothetical protein
MRIIIAIAVLALSVNFAARAHAAPPHTITWAQQNAAIGAKVTIAGQPFTLVRTPVKDLGAGNQDVQVSFLAPGPPASLVGILSTVHSKDPLPNPVQIDGFDANLSVIDGRSYTIMPSFVSPGDYTFTVSASATCIVNIKVGQTLITLTAQLSTVQQPDTTIPTPNAVPFAEWIDYVHPTLQVNGCNKWVDYISIEAVNP